MNADRRRVAIDALASRFGGSAYASIQLARAIASRPDVERVTVATRAHSIVAAGLTGDASVGLCVLPEGGRVELLERIFWEASGLPALLERERSDTLVTMSGMLPRQLGCRVVSVLLNPVMYELTTTQNRLRRAAVRRTAAHAGSVIVPSQRMADMIEPSIGRRCMVAPLGVDHSIFAPSLTPGRDIVCVGDFYKHKRHDLVIAAWEQLAAPRPRLRLIGNPDVDLDTWRLVVARVRAASARGDISVEARVSLDRLVEAYAAARVLVIASERESFCMPIAEAMACGVPAVVRDLPSLRETGGTAARYVAGDDPAAWADAVGAVLDGAWQGAREEALASSKRFSWDALAEAVMADAGERSAARVA